MPESDYIAIDWGTSRRRAYRLDSLGRIRGRHDDDRGAGGLGAGGFPSALAEIRALPVVASGMVGARDGWVDTGYVAAPADLAALAARAVRIEAHGLTIVPGVAVHDAEALDVMRGEEVQALGAAMSGMLPSEALVCQPGTHNKWLHVAGGRIQGFRTAMTGELFALLRGGGTLARFLQAEAMPGPAFAHGVARAAAGRRLAAGLFGVRAAILLGRIDPADAASHVSGLLIGSDVADAGIGEGICVHVLGEPPLAPLYAAAIAQLGGTAIQIPLEPAFVAGIHAIRRLLCPA